MTMIRAQISPIALKLGEQALPQRWPRAIGLGLAALVSASLWLGLIATARHFF